MHLACFTDFLLIPWQTYVGIFPQTVQVMISFSGALAVSPPLETLGFHTGKPTQALLMLFSISTVCLRSPAKPTTTLGKVLGEGG